MASPSPLVLSVGAVGLVFIWSAVHGANVTSSLKDLLAGRAPSAGPTDAGVIALGKAVTPTDAEAPAPVGGNRGIGQLQAAAYGWGSGPEWDALDKLWTRESSWDNTARNPSSGAYGIAQFLDSTWATVGGTKTSDPTLQIQYGLKYIQQRYGDPLAAWAHETSAGWY